MLLSSVILILREVLEAAVLVSVLLALSRSLGQGLRWVWWSLPLALVGSLWFASSMDTLVDDAPGNGLRSITCPD
jgi:high-affinity iron transporter